MNIAKLWRVIEVALERGDPLPEDCRDYLLRVAANMREVSSQRDLCAALGLPKPGPNLKRYRREWARESWVQYVRRVQREYPDRALNGICERTVAGDDFKLSIDAAALEKWVRNAPAVGTDPYLFL